MYVVRDIFKLKFGHFKDAKALLEQATKKGMIPESANARALTDFTGDAYRLILEGTHKTLADYEQSLSGSMGTSEWKDWYEQFKQHVESSHREILKQVI
jgi:hypothetical protein